MKKTKKQLFDKFNTEVTSAIFEFEKAARKVADIEEKIAQLTTPNSVEGVIARLGAVRAAINGRSECWAHQLVQRFCAEKGASRKLKENLRALLKQ